MFSSDGSEKKSKWTAETLISGKVREELHFLCIACHKFVVMGQFRNKCVVVSSEISHGLHKGDQGWIGTYNFVVPGLSEPLF